MKRRKTIVSTFTLITIALSAVVLYTTLFYFGFYRATHSLDITVEKFDVSIEGTYAFTNTTIIIENPSEHAFEVFRVTERLTYDSWGTGGQFISVDTASPTNPWRIQPSSNVTVTMDASISLKRIQPSKPIFVEITTYLNGPLVGVFLLTSYKVFPS